MKPRRINIQAYFGDRRFWDVIDAVAHEREVAHLTFTSDAQWQRIFAAAERCNGLPQFVWLGLLRQRRLCQESQALGISAEVRNRDELAVDRARDERDKNEQARPLRKRSSSGRSRVAVLERDE